MKTIEGKLQAQGLKFVIVATRFNDIIVDRLISGATDYLVRHGGAEKDITLVRVLMLVALICGSAGFWIYIILWIVMPLADTPAKKCEMHGVPPTAENMSRYYSK